MMWKQAVKSNYRRNQLAAACAGFFLVSGLATAQQSAPPATNHNTQTASTNDRDAKSASRDVRELRRKIAAQEQRLDAQDQQIAQMRQALARQQAQFRTLSHSVQSSALAQQRAAGTASGNPSAAAPPPQVAPAAEPDGTRPYTMAPPKTVAGNASGQVGVRPSNDGQPPPVAPIFDQPGVLTPRGKFVLEPSYQFGYSSTDRVALIGYTIVPAIVIGLIDVRQVKTTTQTAALTMRYGITNRLEVELRVPYVDNHTDTISREIFTGSATDRVFTTQGKGLGDIEATARYQFNNGGADSAYFIGWLRYKSRTGRDLFDVTTDCVKRCVQNTTGTGLPLESPTGSGFWSLQPGLTWLYPSDPVVFFGNFSYLHNFTRHDVGLTLVGGGKQPLGDFKVGDIWDVSIGMGLSLNDKASISLGYDQSFVGKTKVNGKTWPGSTRVVLGTLLVGGSYRLSDNKTLNVTLGAGVTRDTPDMSLTVRLPISL
jgi:uncharacterized coiled-coil protein SlyX